MRSDHGLGKHSAPAPEDTPLSHGLVPGLLQGTEVGVLNHPSGPTLRGVSGTHTASLGARAQRGPGLAQLSHSKLGQSQGPAAQPSVSISESLSFIQSL